MSNTTVVMMQSHSAGSTPLADADAVGVTLATLPANDDGASHPATHEPVGEKESRTGLPGTDSGYGSTTSSPEPKRESTSTSFLKDKAKLLKGQLFPKEKKVLKQYSRPLTPAEDARYADLQILFGYALSEWLLNQKKASATIEMRVAVMGETETSTELFILVACQKPVLKSVRQFFAQEAIRDELKPSNKVCPKFEVIVRQQLALFAADEAISVWMALESSAWGVESNCYGKSIMLRTKGKSKVATLGGFLWVVDSGGELIPYGLTAGHVLSATQVASEAGVAEQGGVRDEDHMALSVQSYDGVGVSLGVVDSSLFSSLASDDDEVDDEEDDVDDDDDYEIPCWETPQETRMEDSEQDLQGLFPRYIGYIGASKSASSVCTSGGSKDWALVHLKLPTLVSGLLPPAYSSQSAAWPLAPLLVEVASDDSVNVGQMKDVNVARAGLSNTHGILTKQRSAIMFGSENNFSDVYTLTGLAAQALGAGDSGAWVYDQKTYEVYGHVIGKGLFGDVLVMPMHAIISDVEQKLNASRIWLQGMAIEGSDSTKSDFLPRPNISDKITALSEILARIEQSGTVHAKYSGLDKDISEKKTPPQAATTSAKIFLFVLGLTTSIVLLVFMYAMVFVAKDLASRTSNATAFLSENWRADWRVLLQLSISNATGVAAGAAVATLTILAVTVVAWDGHGGESPERSRIALPARKPNPAQRRKF